MGGCWTRSIRSGSDSASSGSKAATIYLNGTRFHAFIVPCDSAQGEAAYATYEAARETLLRQQSIGVNAVYTHNYGCAPGMHVSFNELLRAADDVGMLVALAQPHCEHYTWSAPDAEQ